MGFLSCAFRNTIFNISFLAHIGLSIIITYELWKSDELIYFGLSSALLGLLYFVEFAFLFLFYISMASNDNEELREYTTSPCLIFSGLFTLFTCGLCIPSSHYQCCILSRNTTPKWLLCLSFIPSIIPIAILSIFSPFLLCISLYYVTDKDIESVIIIFQLIVIISFTILHFLVICNYYLSSLALTLAFLLAICYILIYMFTQITIIPHSSFKLSCCCEFMLLIWYLLLYFMVENDGHDNNQSIQQWLVLIACILFLFPNIPFLSTIVIYRYFNATGNKLYYTFLFEDIDDIIDRLYCIIHIAAHSYNSLGFKNKSNQIQQSSITSLRRIKSVKITPISPLLSKKYSISNISNESQIDENNELIISKHDSFTDLCYQYQYQYMKLNNLEKKQYLNEVIGHESVFRRIIYWFNPNDDNLLNGIIVWISLNILIIVGFFCHFFPMIWFGYIYIYHLNYLNRNDIEANGIVNWLSDKYDNFQHLLITSITLIYVTLLAVIVPSIINVIKQVHFTGYISRILLSGHHPSIHNVKAFYSILQRNIVVIDCCMQSTKIATIVLSFIDDTDIKIVTYHDNDHLIPDNFEPTSTSKAALEIKTTL